MPKVAAKPRAPGEVLDALDEQEEGGWTIGEFADLLNVSAPHVRNLIDRGELEAAEFGGRKIITKRQGKRYIRRKEREAAEKAAERRATAEKRKRERAAASAAVE